MNNKTCIIILLILVIISPIFPKSVQAAEINLVINGEEIKPDVPPTILNGRTLVPVRVISETLGAYVEWEADSKTVNITYHNDKIILKIDNKNAYINDTVVELDVTAKTINGRTMVPIRFISEALGAEVKWVEETRTVEIDKRSSKITGVSLKESDYGHQLQIKGTAPLEYEIKMMSDPERLIIDVKDAVVHVESNLISVGKFGINQIRIGQFQTNPHIARIVLDLENEVRYEIETEQDGEIILLNFINTIEGADYDPEQNIISIYKIGKVDYNVFELANPERLVIDINGAYLNTKSEAIEISDDTIKRIRLAQFQTDPHIVRVVIDLDKKIGGYNLIEKDKEICLLLYNSSLAGKRIIIDPGHGGDDPGATSISGVYEKVLTLDTAERLKTLLKRSGAEVYMTREGDTSIRGPVRAEVANKINGDVLISIHYNSHINPAINGTETLYCPNNTGANKKLAEVVQRELIKQLGSVNRGIKERPGLVLLREANMPSVMAEVGFMSNRNEEQKILNPEYRQMAAQAIYNALTKYFGG